MAFRFTLDVLLRVRQSVERQQELLLQEANQRLAGLRRRMEEVDAQLAQLTARKMRQLESGFSAAELQFDLLCRSVVLQQRAALEQEMAQAEAMRDARREIFREARRQREVIDTLRTHQLQAHRQQEMRQEQRRLDDMFLLRQAYLRRS